MSKQGVKQVFAALLADPKFKKAFFRNKKKALKDGGFRLTPDEFEALLSVRKRDIIVRHTPVPPWEQVLPIKSKPPGGGRPVR